MRIAQVAPLWERILPSTDRGVESVVSRLTDELVRRGHEVVLFASGDSQTLARLAPVCPQALHRDRAVREYAVYEMLELSYLGDRVSEFDVIHSHMGCAALPFARWVKTPVVHTLHGNFSADNRPLFDRHSEQAYITTSNAQREPMPHLNYVGTVYNGLATEDYPFAPQAQDPPYLAFLGKMAPEKGPHLAIAVAQATGYPLKLAGKIDPRDRQFFVQEVAPHIDGQQIQYLGEISHADKVRLLGNAIATLFPITWREPFGLVMIESLATGTPVIAMGLGSVLEVIDHGRTGFVCRSFEEMVAAVAAAPLLDRQDCRNAVLERFSISQMVTGYEAIYQQVITTANAALRSTLRIA